MNGWDTEAYGGELPFDAGLRDLAVESGVITEGSINKVLDGKQYNRVYNFIN